MDIRADVSALTGMARYKDEYFDQARHMLTGKLANWRPATDVRAGSYTDQIPHLRLCDPFFEFDSGSDLEAYARFGDRIFAEAAERNPALRPVLAETRRLWDWRVQQHVNAAAERARRKAEPT